MKRLKMFAIVLISVLLVLLSGRAVFGLTQGALAEYNEQGIIYITGSGSVFGGLRNIYCIKAGQTIDSHNYTKKGTVIISGNNTIVKDKDGNEIYSGTNSYGNKIATCLYLDTLHIIGYFRGTDHGVYNKKKGWISAGQVGLWNYWGDWKAELPALARDLVGGTSGVHCTVHGEWSWWVGYCGDGIHRDSWEKQAEEAAARNFYKVEFDILDNGYGDQPLILVNVTTMVEEEPIDIKVTKTWNDNSNQDGKRPTSVTVKLYENGTETSKSITLSSSNNWQGTFSNLPKTDGDGNEIQYTVKEAGSISGYTSSISGDMEKGYTITNTHSPEKVKFNIVKTWSDDSDRDGKRPSSITVGFYANSTKKQTITLNSSNNWSYTTEEMYKYSNGKEISYEFKEVSVAGYTTGDSTKTKLSTSNDVTTYKVAINNKHTPETINIPVTKKWSDDNNRDGKRPSTVQVELLANGTVSQTVILNESNNWKYTFKNLYKYSNGKEITYTIKEETVTGYTSKVTGDKTSGFTITNTHNPETIKIPVQKLWEDTNDLDEYQPDSIQVQLLANGTVTKTATLNASNGWKYTFSNLYKYEDGKEIAYTIKEQSITKYTSKISGDQTSGYTLTNTHESHYDGYIEISGKVWLDIPDGKANDINGKLDDDESGIGKIKVTLKDANGKQFDATSTAVTSKDGTYTIKVNYDNSKNVYKLYEDSSTVKTKLNTAYVEFEYDGIKYTTVSTAKTGADTSKAIENEKTRKSIDNAHSTVTSSTKKPDEWTDTAITASTKDVITFENYEDITTTTDEVTLKYCNGDGTYIRTNPEGAWNSIKKGTNDLACTSGKGHDITKYSVDVEQIQNVNLGLFEREQPDVAIFSDLSKVEVTMNNQQYTYLYNVRSNNNNNVDIQAKFQNKDTYTYRRPVNPADIAYIQEDAHKDAMSVYVTYEITVGNISQTLPITVHNIINAYDSEYEIDSISKGKNRNIKYEQSNIYKATETEFKEIILKDLNITVQPGEEAGDNDIISIRYKVGGNAISGLLEQEATLNNTVEIESFSTQYGKKTLYAEQNSGGRTGSAYGGYNYNSHPGNANIKLRTGDDGVERLYSTDVNGKIIPVKKMEHDTDIAPSFVLCKDESKILSGTVWEDTDVNESDKERVGDGHKADGEKLVENVKVELFKANDDGSIKELAKLYDKDGNPIEAIVYTDENGYYSFGNDDYSVVTDTYIIKFTYGDGIEEGATKIGETIVNARNYKSTIISDGNVNVYNLFKGTSTSDEWHLNTTKGYSIAVDDIEKRNDIPDLQYSNFNDKINMTAYSKSFKMQVEYDPSEAKESSVGEDGKTTFGRELNIFDFGIIERAKEDIFVETSVEHLKVTLANGQVLTEGNPNGEMSYVKAVGLNQSITKGSEALTALEKQVIMEMDAELIQGAELEVKYSIKVTNNSEMDYDYYDESTGQVRTEYYYFGTNNEMAPEITSSVNSVAYYIDSELHYSWEEEDNGWLKTTADDLKNGGFISEATFKEINSSGYVAYTTDKFKDLACGESSEVEYLTASKLLTNQDDNTYDTHAEILQVDTKTARTLKDYKSGNYVPSLKTRVKNTDVNMEKAGYHEQDDDRIKVMITPPTGTTNYITSYIIVVLAGLIVIAIGLVFIKKKVLTK